MLEHGGKLREAAAEYGIPLEQWVDLSTGINPLGWPVPELPAECWRRLPEEHDGLEQAAGDYYGSASLLPVAGSQAAIESIPRLRKPMKVGVISPGYAEHAHGWAKAGHDVVPLAPDEIETALPQIEVLVVISPNNPTGHSFKREQLLEWRKMLHDRGGWLLVDEAFMDSTPEQSLVPLCPLPGLIVLRSLGKFFGLAGIRVGFIFAWPELLTEVRERLGPWSVSAPAREVARLALIDRSWQSMNRDRLREQSARLADMLNGAGFKQSGSTALFHWIEHPRAVELQQALAKQGIWVRRFDTPASLRFGLPGEEREWDRLALALNLKTADDADVHR